MNVGPAAPEARSLSVLMVTHGRWELTERALAALRAHTECDHELIIVDNGSPDATPQRLRELDDARIVLNEGNRGFGPATNQAARLARGENLLLLNTDAFVHAGFYEAMVRNLATPDVGAVVPRYLHPDGALQEAGALLAQDGSVQVHGDGEDASLLAYRFRRRVDYGGAACLLIARRTFEALGGFDERFAPAYYEDADLCLRLRELGLSVLYEPRATVTHQRFGSGTPERAVALSERNRARFVARWGHRLPGHPWTLLRSDARSTFAARDARAAPRILLDGTHGEPSVESAVRTLHDAYREARLTWLRRPGRADRFDPAPWLDLGVEIVEAETDDWLNDRLFHYDIAVVDPRRPLPNLVPTQPQAQQIPFATVAGEHWGKLVRAGAMPPRSADLSADR